MKRWREPMEQLCQKTYLRTCAPSEDSDQPAHSRSLIRIFTGRILESQGSNVSSCGQRRLWSDCANAQADLSRRWAHLSEGTFFNVRLANVRRDAWTHKTLITTAAGLFSIYFHDFYTYIFCLENKACQFMWIVCRQVLLCLKINYHNKTNRRPSATILFSV